MDKKALTVMSLVFLILAAVTLIFVAVTVNLWVDGSNYEGSLIECNAAFEGIDGKPVYFGEGLDSPTEAFTDLVSKTCASKSFKVSNSNVQNAGQLVKDCWFKGAKGADILGANVENDGVCVYCGSVVASEEVSFQEKFLEEMEQDSYLDLFDDVPDSINANSNYLIVC